MKHLITGTANYASKNDGVEILEGIWLQGNAELNTLTATATNRYTAARGELKMPEGVVSDFDVCLPAESVKTVSDWIKTGTVLKVHALEGKLAVETTNGTITVELGELERYPVTIARIIDEAKTKSYARPADFNLDFNYLKKLAKLKVADDSGWKIEIRTDNKELKGGVINIEPTEPLPGLYWTVLLMPRKDKPYA